MKKTSYFIIILLLLLLTASTDVANELSEQRKKDMEEALENYAEETDIEAIKSIGKQLATVADSNSAISVSYNYCYDGDTCTFETEAGEKIKVRHLLIDTSELKDKKTGKPQPYSTEAKEYTDRMLSNARDIQIVYDAGDRIDKYDRELAYVMIDNELLGVKLLENGLAKVAYINPPNTMYLNEFNHAEEVAKSNKLNLWSEY
ncbi:thermonuclease family protein [Viridibacillus arvi]|uniref:thermonuclease family protein n=1 Tax=Viridibacillus arvi TaxID=263475 RepID=UPI003D2700C1